MEVKPEVISVAICAIILLLIGAFTQDTDWVYIIWGMGVAVWMCRSELF